MTVSIRGIITGVVFAVLAATAISSVNASLSREELNSGYHGNSPAR